METGTFLAGGKFPYNNKPTSRFRSPPLWHVPEGFRGMVEATIEDLAVPPALRGYLTQSDGTAVLSTTLQKDYRGRQAREHRKS